MLCGFHYSWITKRVILRYEGKTNRKATPLFMRLSRGDFLAGCIVCLGATFRILTYSFWGY